MYIYILNCKKIERDSFYFREQGCLPIDTLSSFAYPKTVSSAVLYDLVLQLVVCFIRKVDTLSDIERKQQSNRSYSVNSDYR